MTVLEGADEVLVKADPVAIWTVVVEGAPEADADAEADAEADELTWNGNEYWNVVGSESRLIMKP